MADRQRYNFQMKLLSYTDEGKHLRLINPDAGLAQQKLKFTTQSTTQEVISENVVMMKKRKFYEIDCLNEKSESVVEEKIIASSSTQINVKRLKTHEGDVPGGKNEQKKEKPKSTMKSFFEVAKIVKTTVGVSKISQD